VFSIFAAPRPYFGRPDQQCMINFRVDDLAGVLARLRATGVEVIDETADAEYGKFGWAVDPEGNRFELCQPPSGA
jgi:glyoxylase I family protein